MMNVASLLDTLSIGRKDAATAKTRLRSGPVLSSINPSSGEVIAEIRTSTVADTDRLIDRAVAAFDDWRLVPAPVRGELVRDLGSRLRSAKEPLGQLISLENGKILSEALGEVQEMIDICDFAVGLSRQLYGLTIASERPNHRMMEQWHPLGPVAVITAFNFPMAVWAWNAALSLVCGDTVVWKPSPHTPLTALAVHAICEDLMADHKREGIMQLAIGDGSLGEKLADERRIPLVSFTGSSEIGRTVGSRVAGRLGRSLLELGGNNAIIVLEDANLDLATRAITFGAVGTAGQRCTSTRRVLAASSVVDSLVKRVAAAYATVEIGDPLDSSTLMGPLITSDAVARFEKGVASAIEQGGKLICGGKAIARAGNFVEPTLIQVPQETALPISDNETFGPILYVFEVSDLSVAIAEHNAVAHGLSSAIFTDSVRSAERFLSAAGSDCGIANVNIGTSGAEIGGAFGGEKDTGGGRESGSDSWKTYMRRQTCTVNYGEQLPLAQGVKFL